jgi:hypothetical protein
VHQLQQLKKWQQMQQGPEGDHVHVLDHGRMQVLLWQMVMRLYWQLLWLQVLQVLHIQQLTVEQQLRHHCLRWQQIVFLDQ